MGKRSLCLLFMPIWAPGHIVPMVEAAKRLLQLQCSNSLSITFLLMQPPAADSVSGITDSYLQSVDSFNLPIRFQQLPSVVEMPVHFDSPEEFITIYVQLHIPHVRTAIASSSSRVAALVLDSFATSLIDLGNELKIPSYIFHTSNAAFLALILHLPFLHENIDQQEFSEINGPINIPGVSPVPSHFTPAILMNKKSGAYKSFLYHARRYTEAKGIIVNSSIALEAEALKAVVEGHCTPGISAPEIYPMGPIVSIEQIRPQEHVCLKWLDLQQPKSVVFLCFGSRGGFKLPQIKEMAVGLERSGQQFLWVIQAPCTGISFPTNANLEEVLPEGFTERTKGKGLVWPGSVPQRDILAHRSVGGFVTHCGWNSILESLWFGVPMIPWPLYAEQSLNAFLVVKEMGVALELELDKKNDGFVSADELDRAVRCLTLTEDSDEGKRVREKTDKVKCEFRKAVEKGGTSDACLRRFLEEIEKFDMSG